MVNKSSKYRRQVSCSTLFQLPTQEALIAGVIFSGSLSTLKGRYLINPWCPC